MNTTRGRDLLISAIVIAAVGLVILLVVGITRADDKKEKSDAAEASLVVRPDSHYLDKVGDDKPTLVEFLDFECEVCGAVYPVIESLRKEFSGEFNYVIRYLPLDGHGNSRNAAYAVEAASRQGKIEEMYSAMFTTQKQWGESQEDQSGLFRRYAKEMGLDMKKFDRDVASRSVKNRVQRDFNDGVELKLKGTPSFFLDDKPLQVDSKDGLREALQEAIDGR